MNQNGALFPSGLDLNAPNWTNVTYPLNRPASVIGVLLNWGPQ